MHNINNFGSPSWTALSCIKVLYNRYYYASPNRKFIKSKARQKCLNPLAVDFFGYPSLELIFINLHLARTFFFNVFQLSSAPSTVQGKCIYTFFKAENQQIQFPLLCIKPSKDKHKFFLLKVGSPGANLSATHAQRALSARPIYQLSLPEQSNRVGRFIGQTCISDKIYEPLYRPTTAKGL